MKQSYFLRGRWLKCATCGGAMAGYTLTNKYGSKYRYYGCTSRVNITKQRRCGGSIRCEEADGQVWNAVTTFLLTPGAVLKHLEHAKGQHESEREQIERDQAGITRALDDCDHDDAKWKLAYDKEAIDADELRAYRAEIQARRQRLQQDAEGLQAQLNALALSEEQAQRLVKYSESLVHGIINDRVERITKAAETGRYDALQGEDAITAVELHDVWDDWERRRVALEMLREDTMKELLESRTSEIQAQLDALSIPEKQQLLDQLGLVTLWTRGERLKIIGNFALEYLVGDGARLCAATPTSGRSLRTSWA
jgi:hypothetical protein